MLHVFSPARIKNKLETNGILKNIDFLRFKALGLFVEFFLNIFFLLVQFVLN